MNKCLYCEKPRGIRRNSKTCGSNACQYKHMKRLNSKSVRNKTKIKHIRRQMTLEDFTQPTLPAGIGQ